MRRSYRGSMLVLLTALAMVITTSPPPVATAAGTFTDDDGNVHELNIEAIAAAGITYGCNGDEGLYCPDEPVTRGQMASFLARAFDLPSAGHDLFDDDTGSVHEENINRVAAALVALGYEDGTYRPDAHVTRAQMASFLARAMGLTPVSGGSFVDVDGVHASNINAIAEAGVTVGCTVGGNFYCPDETVRRDQMASFLARALGLATENEVLIASYLDGLPDWDVFLEEIDPNLLAEDAEHRTPDSGATLVTEWLEDTKYECVVTPYTLTSNPREIVMFEPDSNILWTGALLQGNGYVDGLGSLQELPIRQRSPLVISLDLLTTDNTRTVENPTVATVGQAVGDMIAVAESKGLRPAGSVFFEKEESYSVEQSALHMGLSARYLGSSVSAALDAERAANEHSITAYFVEKAFTVSMVLPQLPGDVFSEEFTPEVLDAQVALGRIGDDNLPVYVANVTYGRVLMFTMTSSASMAAIEAALSAMYGGGAFEVAGELRAEHMNLIQESRIQVATIGGNSSNALALIQSGELGAYFAETADLSSYRPISYTIRNLGDNSIAKVAETTEYNLTECTAVAAGNIDVGDRVKITLDYMVIHNDHDGWGAGPGEIYGDLQIDSQLVWSRSAAAALSISSGEAYFFPTDATWTIDVLDADPHTTAWIEGQIRESDPGNDTIVANYRIEVSPHLHGWFADTSDPDITLVYLVEQVGNVYAEDNEPPVVDAGASQSVVIAAAAGSEVDVVMSPVVSDDGVPGADLLYTWSIDSPDPTDATIDHPDPTSPTATLTVRSPDVYTLRLEVSDTLAVGTDTVLIEVVENTPPVAEDLDGDLTVEVEPGETVSIDLIGTDDDGDALAWQIVDQPTKGSVALSEGALSTPVAYTAAEAGTDSFTYSLTDGYDDSNVATVSIVVNSAPTTTDAFETTPAVDPVTITMIASDPDGDPLTWTLTTAPSEGTLGAVTFVDPDWEVVYTPDAGAQAGDEVTVVYTVEDGNGGSADLTVTVTIS